MTDIEKYEWARHEALRLAVAHFGRSKNYTQNTSKIT